MTDSTPDTATSGDSAAATDDELAGLVEETVNSLLKAARARQTYVAGNPLIERFHGELCEKLATVWDAMPHLSLTVDEGRLLWRERQVYAKDLGPDNFAFRFFKDGIRQLALLPGVEEGELEEFIGLLARARPAHDDDLLATLWHRDFKAVRMDYVDVSEDEAGEVPKPDRNAGAGESLEDMTEIEDVLASGEVMEDDIAEFADIALREPDLLYLKREMEAEWARPIVHDVTLALLDQFEMRDQERRRQVVDILREMLPRLLAERDFSNVAMIVNELQLLANKTGEDETQDLVTSLLRDMSEAMAEMVSAADAEGASPGADEMAALIGALQAEAIPTLVRAIPAVPNRHTRDRLAEALDRLVGANPGYVVDLLTAEDPMLAAEAARIVGRLGLREAESDLIELSKRPEDVTRQAAIEALAILGSAVGAQALSTALSDPGKDIRMAAVNAIAAVRPEGAGELLRGMIATGLPDRDAGEQMAFMRAYATLAEDAAVPVLAKLLNGRKWWGGRRAPTVRACAARALGLVGSESARAALEKAASDRAAPVKSAVRVALRALDSDSDERERLATTMDTDEPAEVVEDPIEMGMLADLDDEQGGKR
ncbi:MAG: HEAT repeat domain-containing protein [Candidatus Palauibacterales bacterium]|nr:HEAT repeat domain-containing protein [Candidatus Palauibacterales bacterium]